MPRTYLDHAATSWPKPPGIVEAYSKFQISVGAAAGRGAYSSADIANKTIARVRSKLAQLINAPESNSLAFVSNGTMGLNLAILGLLRSNDHVIASAAEHNSVLRPLSYLRRTRNVATSIIPVDATGRFDPCDIRNAITPATKLIVVTHASNVTGAIQPIEEVTRLARESGILCVVDAAQTLGYVSIDVQAMGIDALVAPGHKGACGLLGTGFLYLDSRLHQDIEVPWCGGTGTDSHDLDGPFVWRELAESGNLNVPALAAWEVGLDWLSSQSADEIQRTNQERRKRLVTIMQSQGLGSVLVADNPGACVPVVSTRTSHLPCTEASALLDSSFQVETRAGLHCAGLIHSHLQTDITGGTLRVSLGHTTTDEDIDRFEAACRELAKAGVRV